MNRPRYILAVNDNEALLRVIADWLKSLGREVRAVLTGREGLRICTEGRPALIVLDYYLRRDGPEVMAMDFVPAFREACSGVPILVMSATDMTLTAEVVGADDFLPIDHHRPLATLLFEKARKLLDISDPKGKP